MEMHLKKIIVILIWIGALVLTGCQAPAQPAAGGLKVLAVETFLADITQNVTGDRVRVEALIPIGLDPHAFEPAPQDVAKISSSQVLVVNGAGFETWLKPVLSNAGGQHIVIEASAGLKSRTAREGEGIAGTAGAPHDAGDPHFWLDPLNVVQYVNNIRAGLTQADPAGAEVYAQNAAVYIQKLKDLDSWIRDQVDLIPPERRLMVTNHESMGYFADRYGFKIAGTVVPGVSSEASPSAQDLVRLVNQIRAAGVKAIFLETGSNPQLARQVAQETGVQVVTDLNTHSITPPGGKAPTYIDMIKWDVQIIVAALR